MDSIVKIEEVDEYRLQNVYGTYQGWKITTTKEEILFLIDNQCSCCESWGHIISNDDVKQYYNKVIRNIEEVDTAYNTRIVENTNELDSGGVVFININFTDGDTLQFAVYNIHNGYYGHSVLFRSIDLNIQTSV